MLNGLATFALALALLFIASYPFLARRKGLAFWQQNFFWRYILWLPAVIAGPVLAVGILLAMIAAEADSSGGAAAAGLVLYSIPVVICIEVLVLVHILLQKPPTNT